MPDNPGNKFPQLPPGEQVYERLGVMSAALQAEIDATVLPGQYWTDEYHVALRAKIKQEQKVEAIKIAREQFERQNPETRVPYIRDTSDVVKELDIGFRTGMRTARNIGEEAREAEDNSIEVAENMGSFGMAGVMYKKAVEFILVACRSLQDEQRDTPNQ